MSLGAALFAAAPTPNHPAAASSFKFASPTRAFLMGRRIPPGSNIGCPSPNLHVLNIEAASPNRTGLPENATRYQLSQGNCRFCLNKDEPYLRMLSIGDRHSRLLLQIYRGACQKIALPSGIYRISAWHDATLVKGKPEIAFLQPAAPDVLLLDANQNPRPGFWAIRPDPAPSTAPATNAKVVSQLMLLKSASAQPENPPSAYGHPLHNLNTATFSRRRNTVPDQQSQIRC